MVRPGRQRGAAPRHRPVPRSPRPAQPLQAGGIIWGWRLCPGFIRSNEVSRRLPDRTGDQDARRSLAPSSKSNFLVESKPVARRLHDAKLTSSPAIRAARYLSQGRHHPRPASSSKTSGKRSCARYSKPSATPARRRLRDWRRLRRRAQVRGGAPLDLPGGEFPPDCGVCSAAAADRIQPIADAASRCSSISGSSATPTAC